MNNFNSFYVFSFFWLFYVSDTCYHPVVPLLEVVPALGEVLLHAGLHLLRVRALIGIAMIEDLHLLEEFLPRTVMLIREVHQCEIQMLMLVISLDYVLFFKGEVY